MGRLTTLSVVALLALVLVAPAAAEKERNDYPTMDRYRYIQECMARQESNSYETLHACACSIDVIAEHLPHDRFIEADTAEKLANIAGESGEVYREPPRHIKEVRMELAEAKAAANERCFVPPMRKRGIWPDF